MNEHTETRTRIHTVITRSAILHVEDALEIGKLRLFALSYEKGKGAKATAYHFLDVADARPLLADLATGKLAEPYTEYKGSRNGGEPVSRVLSIKDKPDQKSAIIVELSRGPGEVIGAGAVKPKGKPTTSVSIFLSRWEARKLALAVLEYLTAYAVMRAIGLADQQATAQEDGESERTFTTAEPEPEPEPEPTEPPPPADATTFWRAVYAAGLGQVDGTAIVRQAAGDWGKALAMLLQGNGGAR